MEALESAEVATEPNFKEPVGGGKIDRHPCPDGTPSKDHVWQCNKTSCPDCWDPTCEENSEKEQSDYDNKQSRDGMTSDEKLEDFKAQIDEEIAAGKEPVGLDFEKQTLDKVGAEQVVHYSYKAHCSVCHVQGELDVVTKNSVIECKNSAKGFKLDQIKNDVGAIAKTCFPDKNLVFATRQSQMRGLESKLSQWQKQGHISSYSTLGV